MGKIPTNFQRLRSSPSLREAKLLGVSEFRLTERLPEDCEAVFRRLAVVIEGSIFFTVVLFFVGFPLSPLVEAAVTALAGGSLQGSMAVYMTMIVAGYVQWFVLAPRLWKVFQIGKEIKF